MKKKRKMSEKKDYSNLFKCKLNLNPWAYKNGFYFFGICVPRRLIWVLLEVCTTTRTKTVKRKRSVLRKLRQDIWRDKTFVRSCSASLESWWGKLKSRLFRNGKQIVTKYCMLQWYLEMALTLHPCLKLHHVQYRHCFYSI